MSALLGRVNSVAGADDRVTRAASSCSTRRRAVLAKFTMIAMVEIDPTAERPFVRVL
jgi:hypothetical protein